MKKTSAAFISEFLVYLLVLAGFNCSVWLGTGWLRPQISGTPPVPKQTESRPVAGGRRPGGAHPPPPPRPSP